MAITQPLESHCQRVRQVDQVGEAGQQAHDQQGDVGVQAGGCRQPGTGEDFEHASSMAPARQCRSRSGGGLRYPRRGASGHREVLGRLRRPAHRPPAAGHPAADGQGRRLGVHPRRRPCLQAAELDEPALPAARRRPASGRWSTRPARSCGSPSRRSSRTPRYELGRRSGPGQGRRRGAPAGAAGRAPGRRFGEGYTLVRREYMTAIGPVDLLCRDAAGGAVAVEVKRRGDIDGVEQLTRYLELMNRDPLLAPVAGHLRRPGDQAAGPGARHGPRHPLRGRRLRHAARHRARRAHALLRPRPRPGSAPTGVRGAQPDRRP